MNETEKERILRMVSEGTLRPSEAAQLLAALAEASSASAAKTEPKTEENAPQKPKPQVLEMQRPDGTHYTIEVPPGLVPGLVKMVGVQIRESARTASLEAWAGLKTIVRNKADEVKTNVKTRVSEVRGGKKEETASGASPEGGSREEPSIEARRRILQMVQNGRISAEDASNLIRQLDALQAYQQAHPPVATPPAAT